MSNFFDRKAPLSCFGNLLSRDQLQIENSWLREELHKAQQKICADKKAFETLFKQSQVDFLTQTPTRMLLHDRAVQAFRLASRQNKSVVLMFLDIDHFKQINDQYGHDVGDQVLVQLTQRLRQTLRSSDTVCRYGGDEFVLLLPLNQQEGDISMTARKILDCVNQPMLIGGRLHSISLSIGIAIYPVHGVTLPELINRADMAMYQAKHLGGQRFHVAAMNTTSPFVALQPITDITADHKAVSLKPKPMP